jgi:hypothetical protein
MDVTTEDRADQIPYLVSGCYSRRLKTIDPHDTEDIKSGMERDFRDAGDWCTFAGVYLLGS